MAPNVLPLTEVADESGMSFVCQDKTFFVKTKRPPYRKSAILVSGGYVKLFFY